MGAKPQKKSKSKNSAEKLVAKSSKKPAPKKGTKKKSPAPAAKKPKKSLSKTLKEASKDLSFVQSEGDQVCLKNQLNFLEGGRQEEVKFIPLNELTFGNTCCEKNCSEPAVEKKSFSQRVKHFIKNLF